LSIDIVYFSNYSGNTKRFVDKLGGVSTRIPVDWDRGDPLAVSREYVLFVPTYGGGSEKSALPRQVRSFLNIEQNRALIRGVVGFGNKNFGEHFCKGAEVVSRKTGVPIIAKVEIFGTPEDVEKVKERLTLLYGQ